MTDLRPMAKLPPPDVYEQEYRFWPWGTLLSDVAEWVRQTVPHRAHIVDYMCGTGYLLEHIHTLRPDLTMEGCDIDPSFVAYGQSAYPAANIAAADARSYVPRRSPDLALCTAGIHHLPRTDQPVLIDRIADVLRPESFLVVGEEVLAAFNSERRRRSAVVAMTASLLLYAIERDAPPPVLEAAGDVLTNDLLERGEYKLSLIKLCELLATRFAVTSYRFTWRADEDDAGDVVLVCRKRI